MLGNRSRLVLPAVLGFALMLVGESKADPVLPTHAFAGAGGYPFTENVGIVGNGSIDTGFVSLQAGQQYAGSARAITDIHADRFLKAYSRVGEYEVPLTSGIASATSSWRDVAFVDLAELPQILRLNFVVDANLSLIEISESAPYYAQGSAQLGLTTTTNPVSFFDPGTRAVVGYPGDLGHQYEASLRDVGGTPAPVQFDVGSNGWDSYSFAGGHFTGYFHIDTTYDAVLGGYGWGVMLQAYSEAFGTGAEVDALNTLSLQSVTLPDGTPLAVTFDSGLQLAAVPEPSSLILAATGVAGLLIRLRRRAARAMETRA